jgi:hypothetical protein
LTASEDGLKYCERKISQFGELRPSIIRNRKKEFSFKAQSSLKMRFTGKNNTQNTGEEAEMAEKEEATELANKDENGSEALVKDFPK